MKLTIENWSYSNIKAEIEVFSHIEKVDLAVFCSEKVIDIFESKNPTEENEQKCKAAAYATAATADAATADVDTAYATAAYAAAYAAYTAANASDVDSDKIKQEIINYINSIKNRVDATFSEREKSVYTQEMADNGELPQVGNKCMFKHQSEDNIMFDDCFIDGYSKCGKFIIFHNHQNQVMQHNIVNGPYRFKPIDTRTDEEKLIDEVAEFIGLISEDVNCSYESGAKALIEKFDIKLK